MKQIFLLSNLLLIGFIGIAQEPIVIPSKIDGITVYPRGAQVERIASKSLSVGRQFVTFNGLASELDPSSISVSAANGINILSVSNAINFLSQAPKPKQIQALTDSLKSYEFDYKFNQNLIGIYAEEKGMILSNKSVGWGGQGTDFVIEDLEDLSDFYRDRLADIMLKVMELEQKQASLNKNINRVRNQLNEQNTKFNRSTVEILVEIYVPSSLTANFKFSYMVRNAGWVPNYNVTVTEVDKPLQFSYNAKVYQNTGVDWDNVTLTLTNANPNVDGNKPEIHPWRLYFIEGYAEGAGVSAYSNRLAIEKTTVSSAMPMRADMADNEKPELGATLDYPANDAVTKFKINTRHSIPSNGKQQGLSIDDFTIPASYQYYCAPKINPAAYLIARVSQFEQYDLLPGEANLFFANTYVGKMYIDPSSIADTLDLSLGIDHSIIVKREKIKEFCETKKIGSSRKEAFGIEISIRNTKSTKIELVIEDQIPVSSDKDISVTLDDAKGAKHKEATGILRWTRIITPSSTEAMRFRYSVKYPSDRNINL